MSMDPELLDRLRRGFPLRMDARGAFWFEGDALEHPGVVAYFRSHLDADEAGDTIILVDGKYVYCHCDDTPLRALRVIDKDGRPQLVLDDGRVVPLDPERLEEQRDRGLRCAAPSQGSGRALAVRLSNTAAMDLDPWIEWPDGEKARPQIVIDERRRTIAEVD